LPRFVEIKKTKRFIGGCGRKMDSIITLVKTNNHVLSLTALIMSVITLFILMLNFWRTGRLIKRYQKLMQGVEGRNLEQMLNAHMESVNRFFAKTEEVESEYKAIRKMAENSIQNVGVVRFNAFDDTGSDLSFAVALLDYYGDGAVISSIYGRSESRTYAKPVNRGESVYHLSAEEEEAIRKALRRTVIN